jgi:hypothetical protein
LDRTRNLLGKKVQIWNCPDIEKEKGGKMKIEELISQYLDLNRLEGKTKDETKEAIIHELENGKMSNISVTELVKIYHVLRQVVGLADVAKQVEEELISKVERVERYDWLNHQICGDFPQIDLRCLVFCCSPAKNCPYRNIALKGIGLNAGDYIEIKKRLAKDMLEMELLC